MMKNENINLAEVIIVMQSVFLMLLSIAGLSAADSVTSMYNALTNASSSAYIITDSSVVTETENISTEQCMHVIQNFELVNTCIFMIGFIIFVSSTFRIFRKLMNSDD